jgi:hypothetical protein
MGLDLLLQQEQHQKKLLDLKMKQSHWWWHQWLW